MKKLIGITCSDNDAHTHLQLSRGYTESIENAGAGTVMIWRCDKERAEAMAKALDGLLVSGGGDVDPALYGAKRHPKTDLIIPERDETEKALIETFLAAGKPIFGICRGIQIINCALGGTLIQDLPEEKGVEHAGTVHKVKAEKGLFLDEIFGSEPFSVNSFHHQAIASPAPGLTVAAYAEDGTVEAVCDPERKIYAVQWHPEKPCPTDMAPLFSALIEKV